MVFKVTTPEKHAPGEVIQTMDIGIDSAVKDALQKVAASGVLSSLFGEAK